MVIRENSWSVCPRLGVKFLEKKKSTIEGLYKYVCVCVGMLPLANEDLQNPTLKTHPESGPCGPQVVKWGKWLQIQ